MKNVLKFLIIVAVIVGVVEGFVHRNSVVAFLSGSTSHDTTGAESSASPDGCALTTVSDPTTTDIGFVIDTTTSTASSFSEGVFSAILGQLQQLYPDKPDAPSDGVPALSTINLNIRLVGDKSLVFGAPGSLSVTIPGVKGLPKRPSIDCFASDGTGTYQQWSQLKQAWDVSYGATVDARDAAIKAITGMPRKAAGGSGVMTTLTALARSTITHGHAAWVVASDFVNNATIQSAGGDLNAFPLFLIAACPSGVAATCDANVNAFAQFATDLNSGPISVFDANQTVDAVGQAFESALS